MKPSLGSQSCKTMQAASWCSLTLTMQLKLEPNPQALMPALQGCAPRRCKPRQQHSKGPDVEVQDSSDLSLQWLCGASFKGFPGVLGHSVSAAAELQWQRQSST